MESPSESTAHFSAVSYKTALCLVPPQKLWESIDSVRSVHDRAWPRWPPHVSLLYPFVEPDLLPRAVDILSRSDLAACSSFQVDLQKADTFVHSKKNTVHLRPPQGQATEIILDLARSIRKNLSMPAGKTFTPHLSMGQCQDVGSSEHELLVKKVEEIGPLSWETPTLSVLVRDAGGTMRLWGSIDLSSRDILRLDAPQNLYENLKAEEAFQIGAKASLVEPSFYFSDSTMSWAPVSEPASSLSVQTQLSRLVVASFNLSEYSNLPMDPSRIKGLFECLLSDRALADILVLQSVSHSMLSEILNNAMIRNHYRHSTQSLESHGTVSDCQGSLILSRWLVHWQTLDLQSAHNSCMVAKLPTVELQKSPEAAGQSLAIAACKFTHDLTEEAVKAKTRDLRTVTAYLRAECSQNSWILAGDLGITTSSVTIKHALENKKLSRSGLEELTKTDPILSSLGFMDAWMAARLGIGESSGLGADREDLNDLHEGEEAFTCCFTPEDSGEKHINVQTPATAQRQRCARVLVGKQSGLRPGGFNLFTPKDHSNSNTRSLHRGVRCLLLPQGSTKNMSYSDEAAPIQLQRAPPSLASFDLKEFLHAHELIPSTMDHELCQKSFKVLEEIILDKTAGSPGPKMSPAVNLVLTTVGSFGLGVGSKTSTIRCLCIGNISSSTFFSLATQRLRHSQGTRVHNLKKGKDSGGPKFELEFHDTRFDIYYCAAAAIADRWPEVMRRPSSDPDFSLSFQTLAQLKPVRDLYYLRKSIPDLAQYRLAHMAIRVWAQSRGLLDEQLGLLADAHITALLVPVCKMLAFEGGNISTAALITTFFHHYADFDWRTKPIFDPFFHHKLAYQRGFREILCLLGWHSPALNTATNFTEATAGQVFAEFRRARKLLKQEDLTWCRFLGFVDQTTRIAESASQEFLRSYLLYARIEIRCWGHSTVKLHKVVKRLKRELARTLLDIDGKLPSVKSRVWPDPFVERSAMMDHGQGVEYHANYLVGLDLQEAKLTANDEAELASILQGHDRRTSNHCNARILWMRSSLAWSHELRSLDLEQIRRQETGNTDGMDSEDCDSLSDQEDDEWDDETRHQAEGGTSMLDGAPRVTWAAHPGKHSTTVPSVSSAETKAGRKLRSAADVMNRLRWDPTMDAGDYVVGYVDRFKGPQEKSLEQWKSEQTDEDFIPQHRILYFKRVEDGAVVWDRRARLDEVFGSGFDAI